MRRALTHAVDDDRLTGRGACPINRTVDRPPSPPSDRPAAPPRPFVIGVAGGTGSGKTSIARKLAEGLPSGTSAIIEFDSYYRDLTDLSAEARAATNFDHPDALESDLLADHLRRLRQGEPVEIPIYDFVAHTRRPETRTVAPTRILVVEGILALALAHVRQHCDLKIFVDTDADIRVFRRIRRDLEERGRSFASVREQYYGTVRPMHQQFVEPSKRWADLIVPEGGGNRVALEVLAARLLQVATA
jgi:uridine kinase